MRPKFLADADFNHDIVTGRWLREPAIDFLSATESGIRGLPDPEVLQIGAESGRILVSHDRKTMTAHFDNFVVRRTSLGLFIASQYLAVGEAIEELLLIWATSDAVEWRNQRRFLPL